MRAHAPLKILFVCGFTYCNAHNIKVFNVIVAPATNYIIARARDFVNTAAGAIDNL